MQIYVSFIANKSEPGHLGHKLANKWATGLDYQGMDPFFFHLRQLQIGCRVCLLSGLPWKLKRADPETDR